MSMSSTVLVTVRSIVRSTEPSSLIGNEKLYTEASSRSMSLEIKKRHVLRCPPKGSIPRVALRWTPYAVHCIASFKINI